MVPQDYKESVKWFSLAAEQGDAHAQYNLGLMYLNGYGVVQSYEDTYAWWVVAAANGSESARGNMRVVQGGANDAQANRKRSTVSQRDLDKVRQLESAILR